MSKQGGTMKESVAFLHNQNRTQFMCTCKDKEYLTKATMGFIDCVARKLNMKGSDFYSYIYGRYLRNIILDASGNGAKDK